jgi:hypothetical protein
LHRDKHRVSAKQSAYVIDKGLDMVGLDREDDQILRTDRPDVVRGVHMPNQMLAAIVEDKPQAVLLDRGEVCTARDYRDFVPNRGEQHREVPPDRSRTHHTNFHIRHRSEVRTLAVREQVMEDARESQAQLASSGARCLQGTRAVAAPHRD